MLEQDFKSQVHGVSSAAAAAESLQSCDSNIVVWGLGYGLPLGD